jgi:hypothetical protein
MKQVVVTPTDNPKVAFTWDATMRQIDIVKGKYLYSYRLDDTGQFVPNGSRPKPPRLPTNIGK